MKNPGLAAVLSFFLSGLGQVYNGQIGKGVLFFSIQCVGIGFWFTRIAVVIGAIAWVWGMIDAYKTAERLNETANLARCPDCKRHVSPSALSCPHCGRPGPFAKMSPTAEPSALSPVTEPKRAGTSPMLTDSQSVPLGLGPEDYHIESAYVPGTTRKEPHGVGSLMAWWRRLRSF